MRKSACVTGALLFFLTLVLGSGGTALAEESLPNFVFILADDLGYGDLACYGNKIVRTPNLDRLAADGVRFTNCYAASPVCSPSRAGILTGRWPDRAGIHEIVLGNSPAHLIPSHHSVADLLKASGYATAIFGKWHLTSTFDGSQGTPADHGFDYWLCTLDNAGPSHKDPTNFWLNGRPVGPVAGYSNDILVQQAHIWLQNLRSKTSPNKNTQPFCLFIWLHSPHEPIASPPELVSHYSKKIKPNRAEYFANVTHIDRAVGELLEHLDGMGLTKNTMVMFTSDNGPEILNRYPGAERSYGSSGGLRGAKLSLYEGGIRIPGIIRWPDIVAPGQVSNTPISGLDILPTFCELANVAVPPDLDLDGTSFAPLLRGSTFPRPRPLYWQLYRGLDGAKAAMRAGNWKILADWDGPQFKYSEKVDAKLQKLMANARLKNFRVFDLAHDPNEKHNIAAQAPFLTAFLSISLKMNWEKPERDWPAWR